MAGALEVQLPATQGQCSFLERASHRPVRPSRCFHSLPPHRTHPAIGGAQCGAKRSHVRHYHRAHHKPRQARGALLSITPLLQSLRRANYVGLFVLSCLHPNNAIVPKGI